MIPVPRAQDKSLDDVAKEMKRSARRAASGKKPRTGSTSMRKDSPSSQRSDIVDMHDISLSSIANQSQQAKELEVGTTLNAHRPQQLARVDNDTAAAGSQQPQLEPQIESPHYVDEVVMSKYARSYNRHKQYKMSWKIFTLVSSLALVGYLGVEIYALNAIARGVEADTQSNRTVRYLMNAFQHMENLLFINIYMNLILYIIGATTIMYSLIILLIENDEPWKWMRNIHKKIAKYSYIAYMLGFTIGALIQSVFIVINPRDKSIQKGLGFYLQTIVKGVMFYYNMLCFMKCEKFKYVQAEIFKDTMELKRLKLDQEEQLTSNWEKIYDADLDEDEDFCEDEEEEAHQADGLPSDDRPDSNQPQEEKPQQQGETKDQAGVENFEKREV